MRSATFSKDWLRAAIGGAQDNFYGHLTEQAVFAIQKANGLYRDGVVGPNVNAALEQRLSTPAGFQRRLHRGQQGPADPARGAQWRNQHDVQHLDSQRRAIRV
ncbi:peptidoglycan-binding protein [Ornithinimicrobium sp. INDO-MA30-4]|uniref:peptidoglycan-binding domain-containing protein n=1 Tax=Ornithinimicrobium sp. INDO-MA30-4 TaxID=2908651 RepID=UPI001F319FC4|nr:peptidoglycan-binding protein [Ornithinimicrobium sp. INDO-MA30-4]UJH70437.1 peptidoglycan-binding protein [Ornithinimicrobium sp. INDO-MA30-4]